MKKDIYNGKVRKEFVRYTSGSIILFSVLLCVLAVFFLCIALFYPKTDYAARVALYVISAVSVVFAIVYPLVTILCIRSYPKHKKLTHLFIKQFVLTDYTDENAEQFEEEEQSTVNN